MQSIPGRKAGNRGHAEMQDGVAILLYDNALALDGNGRWIVELGFDLEVPVVRGLQQSGHADNRGGDLMGHRPTDVNHGVGPVHQQRAIADRIVEAPEGIGGCRIEIIRHGLAAGRGHAPNQCTACRDNYRGRTRERLPLGHSRILHSSLLIQPPPSSGRHRGAVYSIAHADAAGPLVPRHALTAPPSPRVAVAAEATSSYHPDLIAAITPRHA